MLTSWKEALQEKDLKGSSKEDGALSVVLSGKTRGKEQKLKH